MYSFPSTVPALTGANPSRPGWSLADAVTRLADEVTGLAAGILAHGYDASRPVRVCANDGHTMATLAAGILAGLDARQDKAGKTRPLILAAGAPVSVDSIRLLLAEADPHSYTPDYMIPEHGGGNHRVIAYMLAHLYQTALCREDTCGEMAYVDIGSAGNVAGGLTDNVLDSYRTALVPWQKVIATVAVLKANPILLG